MTLNSQQTTQENIFPLEKEEMWTWDLRISIVSKIGLILEHSGNKTNEEVLLGLEEYIKNIEIDYPGEHAIMNTLKGGIDSLKNKNEEIKDFKINGLNCKYLPEDVKEFLCKVPYKIIYSNFWVFFIISQKYVSANSPSGQYFSDTPFSVVTSDKKVTSTYNTLQHEGRHNMYNAFFGSTIYSGVDNMLKQLNGLECSKQGKMPQMIIDGFQSSYEKSVKNFILWHLRANRDEILANFHGLAFGKLSTETLNARLDLQKLKNEREKRLLEWKTVDMIDEAIDQYKKVAGGFYSHFKDFLLVGRLTNSLKDIYMLLYLIDINDYSLIERFLRTKIWNELYDTIVHQWRKTKIIKPIL